MNDTLILLDGYSLIYRAYHALQVPMTAPDGTPTNAVHGFMMMLLKVLEDEQPSHIAVAFDMHAPTFRAKLFAGYKATRKPMPDDLRLQVPVIRELIALMGIPIWEKESWEADDICGTISRLGEEAGREVRIVTGDRDSFQLVGDHTTILFTQKGTTELRRVTPDYIRETYGIEPKQLIDVKALMGDTSDNIPGVPGIGEKTALKLISENGTLERVLETADTAQKGKLREKLLLGAESARMSRVLAEIDRRAAIDFDWDACRVGDIAAASARLRELSLLTVLKRLNEVSKIYTTEPETTEANEALPPIETLKDAAELRARCEALAAGAKYAAFYAGADFTVATDAARLTLPLGGDLLSLGIADAEAWEAAQPLTESGCPKYVYDIKNLPVLPNGDVTDIMLAAYVLNPQTASFAAVDLCEGFDAHPATAIAQTARKQLADLEKEDMLSVYRDIELPLAGVLRRMERIGFLVDADVLTNLETLFTTKINELTEAITRVAGEKINLNSPKQLAELLYTRMGIPAANPKKPSTNAEALEALAEDYPICGQILEYRKYQKLNSTYTQAILRLRDENGRVHTRFDQVATATGRISSNEPNLQNIPVRTELGRAIRAAFIARPGWTLVDADYSQIELRVLAHMSGDPTMIRAFNEGEDIHTRTAAEVWGVPIAEVTPEMRSASKAVNFGIVYGISDFSLAKNIGVSRFRAKEFIDRYFERYPLVKIYMDRAVDAGHANGYVSTLMNRRRYLPELNSNNFNLRAFGERCAMNSPIQGTAADIIKLAMIAVDRALTEENLRARLLLQVHDELIIECPEEETDRVRELLRRCMENVMTLAVPLRADISTGGDWRACK